MDYKKTNAPTNTVTRDMADFREKTGNVYESIAIMGKRANQISVEIKEELKKKLDEFSSSSDNLEEVFENREQIEISRYYERLPKPTLIATQEFIEDKVYYRNPLKENNNLGRGLPAALLIHTHGAGTHLQQPGELSLVHSCFPPQGGNSGSHHVDHLVLYLWD